MKRVIEVTQEVEDALIASVGLSDAGAPSGDTRTRHFREMDPRRQKGGPGSGNFAPGHQGRPGQRGGSTSAGGAGGTVHRAGITSARPGKTTEDMQSLKRDLSAVAKNVDISMGTGGWEGGSEPTHLLSYENGAESLAVLASYAKKHDQDAALVFRAARKSDPGAAPMQSLSFDRPLARPAMEVVESQLVSAGIGGWSWSERNGKTTLIVASVPDWGADAKKDLAAIQGLRDALNGAGANATYAQDYVTVTVMEKGNYGKWIR